MVWLADQGLQVVGIEICQLAIDKLFTEYYPRQDYQQNGNIFSAGNITIIKGDLYNCPELKILAPFDLIYDRASLVAINYEDREKYIDLILSLLSPQAVSNLCYFLQGADYQPGQHFDPPHIFTQESAEFYFGKKFKKIQHVVRIDEGINFPSQVHLHSDHWIMGGRL